jgi:uncharacterized protein YbaR (Trm112 family)
MGTGVRAGVLVVETQLRFLYNLGMSYVPVQILDAETIAILRCPVTGSPLRLEDDHLISEVGALRYPIRNGVPVLLVEEAKLPAGIETLAAFRSRFADKIASHIDRA